MSLSSHRWILKWVAVTWTSCSDLDKSLQLILKSSNGCWATLHFTFEYLHYLTSRPATRTPTPTPTLNIQENCFAANTQALCHVICHSRGGISITIQISGKSCVHIIVATLRPLYNGIYIIMWSSYMSDWVLFTFWLLYVSIMKLQACFWIKLSSLWVACE